MDLPKSVEVLLLLVTIVSVVLALYRPGQWP
jgi:hypothetical protein